MSFAECFTQYTKYGIKDDKSVIADSDIQARSFGAYVNKQPVAHFSHGICCFQHIQQH